MNNLILRKNHCMDKDREVNSSYSLSYVQTDATIPNIVGSNNVGNCCVRVGSGVQTDATIPNIVGSNNVESCCVRVGSGVRKDATTPNNVGTCSAL